MFCLVGFKINVELKYISIKTQNLGGEIIDLRHSRVLALNKSASANNFHQNVVKDVCCNL